MRIAAAVVLFAACSSPAEPAANEPMTLEQFVRENPVPPEPIDAAPTPVDAAPRDPREQAKESFEAGKKAFRLEDYDEAIRLWELGYTQEPDPTFLYNLALAHEKRGDRKRAADHYRRYLDAVPDSPKRKEIEAQIRELEAQP